MNTNVGLFYLITTYKTKEVIMPPKKTQALPLPLPTEGFVRLPQVLAVIPVSKTQFWEGIKTGRFPAPIKLGQRTTAWRVEDIRALIARLSLGEII